MKDKGHPYTGFLYVGIMIVNNEPYVIEFNVRMGDPETQVVIPLLKDSFYSLLNSCLSGNLKNVNLEISSKTAVTIVLAADGYPNSYNKGMEIFELDQIEDGSVFHAGTSRVNEKIITNGGRVLNVVGIGDNLKDAILKAYKLAEKISF